MTAEPRQSTIGSQRAEVRVREGRCIREGSTETEGEGMSGKRIS